MVYRSKGKGVPPCFGGQNLAIFNNLFKILQNGKFDYKMGYIYITKFHFETLICNVAIVCGLVSLTVDFTGSNVFLTRFWIMLR